MKSSGNQAGRRHHCRAEPTGHSMVIRFIHFTLTLSSQAQPACPPGSPRVPWRLVQERVYSYIGKKNRRGKVQSNSEASLLRPPHTHTQPGNHIPPRTAPPHSTRLGSFQLQTSTSATALQPPLPSPPLMITDLHPKLDDEGAAFKRPTKSPEPTSVLYNRSPSPPTSSSYSSAPPPISAEDWEAVLSGSADDMAAPAAQPQDSSFLRWIMDAGYADGDGDAFGFKGPAFDPPLFLLPPPPPPPNQDQDQEIFLLPQLPPQLPPQAEDLQPQAAVDDLLEAARLADAGDSTSARGILARLNHRLPSPPTPGHPPLLRAAAHLRDALLRLLPPTALPPGSVHSPLDVALKLAAHKALADASPSVQFASFTSTQAFLEALGSARRVHLVDFDVGFGGHWPPLMQELAHQWRRTASLLPPTTLKVTALVSPGSKHPLELHLTQESLTRFAAELGIPFEFNAIVFDPFDPSPPMGLSAAPDESVAVHVPIGSEAFTPTPTSLRVMKQLRPSIVVCVDHGCDRGNLPLQHHALNVLRSCAALLESLDTAGASPDVVAKVEQFIVRPRVEHLVLGTKLPPWQSMFASTGFAPLQLSNAAEAQAECLLRRTANHGFHVDKRQAALALSWQRSELVSVSAWRC